MTASSCRKMTQVVVNILTVERFQALLYISQLDLSCLLPKLLYR